nr:hypothetical protein BaRGS_009200 [Batillaria attramentaria]
MLMVVCLVYTLCTAPTVVEAITRVFVADFVAGGRYNNIFFASLFISHLFESVNCSINFIIYYTMSTRFRETLRDMVHRKDAKKKKKQVESNTRVSRWFKSQNPESVCTATNGFDVNGSGLLSASTLEKFEVVVNAGILPALVVFGVTMNVINMAVFARQGLRDRINLCLFSPLRAKNLLSTRQTAAIVLTLYTVSFAGKALGSFKYTVEETTDPNTNETSLHTETTDFYINNLQYFYGIYEITFNIVIPTVSLFVVIAATFVIAVRMRSVLAWRKETAHVGAPNPKPSTSQREAAVTRMLMVVCLVYTFCTTPTAVQALARMFVAEFVGGGRYNNIFFASLVITHLMESVNCSINFIVYYAMSTRFRETLRDMVHRGDVKMKREKEDGVSSVASSDHVPRITKI